MTYIAAFKCLGGVVICADTQETIGDYKQYTEKLLVVPNAAYPLAVGGAGAGDVVEPIMDEIIHKAADEKPSTQKDLLSMLRSAVNFVFENEISALVLSRQQRVPQFLVAAKPSAEDYCIFRIVGKRVYRDNCKKAIIGFGSANNNSLLNRFHRTDLPMQQAVMLAIYLVSQSKKLDDGVGFDTRVAVVTSNAAALEEAPYVANSEQRVSDFLRLTDALFLASIDNTIPPSKFPDVLTQFGSAVAELRDRFLRETAAIMLNLTLAGQSGVWTYPKIFPGAVIEVGTFGVRAREDTPEELERRRQMFEALKESSNQLANRQFIEMIGNRVPLYLGEETIQVRGTAGVVDSGNS
jgi:20S proteasome alpha/beta subunit